MSGPDGKIVIVGGGPAGLSTALFLAHAAPTLRERIVVLEKSTYPREKPCAGAIGGRAERALAAIDVRVDVPSVGISAMRARLATGSIGGEHRIIGRVVRRYEYDAELARLTRARGIAMEQGARVAGITFRDDGATVALEGGTIEASVVIGADGVGSVVRRALGIPFGRMRAQVVEVDTEPVPTDPPRSELGFDFSDTTFAGYTWDFPTLVDGKALVCRGAYVLYGTRHHESGPDPESVLSAHLARLGLDPRRYRRKRYSERGLSLSRPIARPRALLVGEAAGIDPLLGEGIAQAILYGSLAARYLAPKLVSADYAFADWRRAVLSSRMGVDLAARIALADAFFGPLRPHFEAYARAEPAFMRAGLRYFGGDRSIHHFLGAFWGAAKYVGQTALASGVRAGLAQRDRSTPSQAPAGIV